MVFDLLSLRSNEAVAYPSTLVAILLLRNGYVKEVAKCSQMTP